MTSLMTDGALSGTEPRQLLDQQLFDRLVDNIVTQAGHKRCFAERLMGQTVAYLVACAQNPGADLIPSKTVDVGWHTFLLHTRDYMAFCDRVAGRFLHHDPPTPERLHAGPPLTDTTAAIEAAGFTVDEDLWRVEDAHCCNGLT